MEKTAPVRTNDVAVRARMLGRALRARRKALGINMTTAAEAAGISRVTWHRLEKGELGVSWGGLLAAAAVIGMDLHLFATSQMPVQTVAPADNALPLQIVLSEFPELRRLAWQVGGQVDTVTPREAVGLYVRNARHLDVGALSENEKKLLRALRDVFGEELPGV